MANETKRVRKRQPAIVDYIAFVDRTALSYSINHYGPKWMAFHPYSRSLYLYGRMAHPQPGMSMNTLLVGDTSLAEIPSAPLGERIAGVRKHGNEYQFFANAPMEFISTLSTAYSDHRLQIIYARGPKLFRGTASLTHIRFRDRASFEEEWRDTLEG